MKGKCVWCGKKVFQAWNFTNLLSLNPLNYPKRCLKCDDSLTVLSEGLCCPYCSRLQKNESICKDCIRWKKLYPNRVFAHKALFSYQGLCRDWLHRYKYQKDYRLVNFFKEEIVAMIQKEFTGMIIIPIPSSHQSFEKRGFDQIQEILDACDLNYEKALEHRGSEIKQAEKSRRERMESMQMFTLNRSVLDQDILLMDDVYTTGRTMMHAYDICEAGGARKIYTFSIAR